jgi:hypothetical protein
MAKKKSKGKFEFSKIGKIVSGISDKTGIQIEDSDNMEKKEFIGTGIYALNALFSKSILNGGIQNNRITAIAGPTGVGKSFLCYNICREAQKDGYSIIYIDTEFSIELSDMESYGIDIDSSKLQLVRTNAVEDLKIMLTQLLGELKENKLSGLEIDKFMIVIDSAGQLASRKEVEDAKAGKEKADMTRAKAMKSLFRIVNSDLGFLKVPMLVTNHTYLTMDLFPRPVMSGGCLEAGNKVVTDKGLVNIEDLKYGDYVDTLNGFEKIYDTFEFEKERYEVEFEDGTKIICSDEHKFLMGKDWTESGDWKLASDLNEGDIIPNFIEEKTI